ncbi:MAG: hypothetical protein ACI4JW_08955 [Oscillospiraceae bacterium]
MDKQTKPDSVKVGQKPFNKRRFAVRIICAGITFLVLVFSIITLGWFTNSRSNSAGSLEMKAANNGFELAAVGTGGIYDSFLSDREEGTEIKTVTEDSSEITLVSTGGKSEIKWVMNGDSNIVNNSGVSKELGGIAPGSSGTLTFYVIPQQDGALDISFSLDTALYKAENDSLSVIADSDAVNDLAGGHILFFKNKNGNIYSDRIDKSFRFSRDDLKKDVAYKVDIYWIWPGFADQLIMSSGDPLLEEKGERIIADNDETFYVDISENPKRYFRDTTKLVNIQSILDNMKAGSLSAGFNSDAYEEINTQWNEADQYIGVSASYIELILSVG